MNMKACSVITRMWNTAQMKPEHDLAEHADQPPTVSRLAKPGQREQRDQQEDHLAGEQVAEESQRQRDGPGEESAPDSSSKLTGISSTCTTLFCWKGCSGELAEEAAEPLHLDAVEDDQQEDGERQGESDVDVRARHHLQVLDADAVRDGRQQVHRQQVHGIEEEHPAEDRQRQRRDELVGAVEGFLDLVVDELDDDLDEVLELARHADASPGAPPR